jgi:hypothetical protein
LRTLFGIEAASRCYNHYYDKDGNRVNCEPGSTPDGIEARDQTIKLLRAEVTPSTTRRL